MDRRGPKPGKPRGPRSPRLDALQLDPEDEWLRDYTLYLPDTGYARLTWGSQPKLHRFLLNAPDGTDVDHLNGDRLDNRKENLRLVSRAENLINRDRPLGTNPYIGVYLHKPTGRYQPAIGYKGKNIRMPLCDTPEEANRARLLKEKELYGVQPRRLQFFLDAGIEPS